MMTLTRGGVYRPGFSIMVIQDVCGGGGDFRKQYLIPLLIGYGDCF